MPDYRRFRLVGTSLWPAVPASAEAIVCAPKHPLPPGSLVVYVSLRNYVCHRVLWRKKMDGIDWYYISGNFRTGPDGWIPHYRLVGKVVELEESKLNSPFKLGIGLGWAAIAALRILVRFGGWP